MAIIKETKLGVKIIVLFTLFCAIKNCSLSLMFLFMLIKSPYADRIYIVILSFLISTLLIYLFVKLAFMTYRMESKAWWFQMILSFIGLFAVVPFTLIFIIYLWLNRALFGIKIYSNSKEHQEEKL